MKQVIGFEGIPERWAPLTYGAAAIRDGDALVNAVTGVRSTPFEERLERNKKSLVLFPSPYRLLANEAVEFVLEVRHPLLRQVFYPDKNLMHKCGLMAVPCAGFSNWEDAGIHAYFFESWEALTPVRYEMAAFLQGLMREAPEVLSKAARTLDERIVKEDTEDLLMDYGERRDRAERLVRILRENPDMKPYKNVTTGQVYSPAEVADEIENMTLVGKTLVAVAGLVECALVNDPELRARVREKGQWEKNQENQENG
jgi:hypothetical protein